MFISVDSCDSDNSGVLIGVVVGVFCIVIIIMVITNIMVWIYCFRKKHHVDEGMAITVYVHSAKLW